MGRRKKTLWQPLPPGPYPCYLACGRSLRTKLDRRAIEGWNWFTGYGENPVHFCPQCYVTRRVEIDRIREKLDTRPEGYPDVRQTI